MARPSKLTETQCRLIRALKTDPVDPVSAPMLAKRFKVSESSIYKVLDGSYVARKDDGNRQHPESVSPAKPEGAMPSIFQNTDNGGNRIRETTHGTRSNTLTSLLEQAAKADLEPVDDVTLAAAELILARAKLTRMLTLG